MKRSNKIAMAVIASLGLGFGFATVVAHPGGMGGGMMHDMGSGHAAGLMGGRMPGAMQQDEASSADMGLVHELIVNHERIQRTVVNLPNGIRTVTESDDPQTAQAIEAHVASMAGRLSDGREFNMFSRTVPVLFENRHKIQTQVATTGKGSIVTETSPDATVVVALQGHASEVSELARDGMAAMMRSAMAGRGAAPRAGMGSNSSPAARAPVDVEHAH